MRHEALFRSHSILLAYNGQKDADEVKQTAMTQSSAWYPTGTGLGLRTCNILRFERQCWTVPQAWPDCTVKSVLRNVHSASLRSAVLPAHDGAAQRHRAERAKLYKLASSPNGALLSQCGV